MKYTLTAVDAEGSTIGEWEIWQAERAARTAVHLVRDRAARVTIRPELPDAVRAAIAREMR